MPRVLRADKTEYEFSQREFKEVLSRAAQGLAHVNVESTAREVERLLPDTLTEAELLELAAGTVNSHTLKHHEWGLFGGRLFCERLYLDAAPAFSECVERLYSHKDLHGDSPLVSEEVYTFVKANAARLDAAIDQTRDYDLNYFSLRTLARAYLITTTNGIVQETPQYMWMRVACGISKGSLEDALQVYHDMSQRLYTHATPTLFNSGTPRPQLSSCFLLQVQDDSIEGIFNTYKQCAQISKHAGGIGLSFHNVRARGSRIRTTNGKSNGLVPFLRILNNVSVAIDQGGGKRKGSVAVYLEPWHGDIMEFLELKIPIGTEENRARDLFYALWIPDLFMKRVRENKPWTLMCPDMCPGLSEVHGEEFEALYEKYEKEGRGLRTVKATQIWFKILTSQVETGMPYMLYKDACNAKSNQKNLGTIKSSNLCTEVVLYTSPSEIAVCNLASMVLPRFVEEGSFNFEAFGEAVERVTANLNRVIDLNFYPLPEARHSNMRHRPVGIGIQGLADVLARMGIAYDSQEALDLDFRIFERLYYHALKSSCDIAVRDGKYESFDGSPASQGQLQFDLWERTEEVYEKGLLGKDRWSALRERIVRDGLRNSVLVSPMPTASTAQICGSFVQAFHAIPSVLYQRRTMSGDFLLCCPAFQDRMCEEGAWTPQVQEALKRAQGKVDDPQVSALIPDHVRSLFKSVYDMKQKWVVDHALARAPFIDQSQSMEIFMENPTTNTLSSMHMYAWSRGLKTGLYYLRSKAKAKSINFAVTHDAGRDDDEECLNCSS